MFLNHAEEQNFRAQLDQTYRRRALENHLRGVPMFADLSPEFIEHLKESVELQRFAPGQVIVQQGARAGSFYLVRIGFVKVSENYPGGELVLAYLSRGDYFGEIGLLGGGVRTALALPRSRRTRSDLWRRFRRHGCAVPQRSNRSRNVAAEPARLISSACNWFTTFPSINFSRKD